MNKLRINELLKENKMSFSELSHRLDVKRTTLYSIFKKEEVSLQNLSAIAQVFQCALSDLLEVEQVFIVNATVKYEDVEFDLDYIDDYANFIQLLCNKFGFETDIKMRLSENSEE